MKHILFAPFAVLALATASHAEQEFPAKLVSHAILPANTIIAAPADAPEYLKTSAKFTTADRKRAEGLGTVPGKDGVRPTGLSMPFNGRHAGLFPASRPWQTAASGAFPTMVSARSSTPAMAC